MLPLLLSATLLLGPTTAREPADGPSAEDVARVESALDQAYRANDEKAIQAALEAAQGVPHAAVVRKVVVALNDERPEVVLAAVQALRWLAHPAAVEALERLARDKKRMKSPELFGAVLRALGQHAAPSSIAILARDPFEPKDHTCVRARIFGLGRIRSVESLEALIGILGTTGPDGRERRVQGHMDDARLSLMLLTGVDQGRSPELWERWWRANKKTFRIPDQAPLLPRELREPWDQFFGLPMEYERGGRREDRGREPARPTKEPGREEG